MYDYTVDERKLMMKEAFRGSGIGVIFMAVFGTLWAGTGVMGLQGWGFPYVELAAYLWESSWLSLAFH
ncbi:hypothetical protein ABEI56_11470 [Peribacillus castrilensis]|uniref:hypothetical protein n=1 Tax=Peribacillus castrilensis TaxID=2897690 RepID=UPI003D2AF9A5